MPHVFADFPVSKYLYRTEEDPPDKAYKEFMEKTKERRATLEKAGGARLEAFEKKVEQVWRCVKHVEFAVCLHGRGPQKVQRHHISGSPSKP